MRHNVSTAPLLFYAATVLAIAAGSAAAGPLYTLDTLIAVPAGPNNSVGGNFATYDISFFDDSTQMYYVADRSNASVDVFSAVTDTFVTRIGTFAGQKATNAVSGPDGVVVVNLPGQHQLWAGDGDSTLKGFDLANGNAPLANTPLATGTPADNRVDEMSFDPQNQRLLVANNAATPSPFATLVDTTNNTITHKIVFDGTNGTPNATGGIEQSVWDPNSKHFYLSIPQIGASGPGGLAMIDPLTGQVTKVFDLASFGFASCSPAGLARGKGSQLLIGCSNASQSILFDPTAKGGNGAVVASFAQVSGADMVWFDPKTGRFFVAARDNPGGPVLGIIDGIGDSFLENIPTTPGDHSVAVDPVSGDVFMPFGGVAGNNECPNGCIAVFAPVPEPAQWPLILGFTAIGGLAWRRRRLRFQ